MSFVDKFEIFQITAMRNPNEIVADALNAIHASPDLPNLEQVKAAYLGKSGQLTELLKSLGAMPADERKTAGARILKPAQDTFWGGYAGYFADPDGYVWEVAWGEMFDFKPDGTLQFKPGNAG